MHYLIRHSDDGLITQQRTLSSLKMSTYSEEGSEAAVDEDLQRDLDSLRKVLEEEEPAGRERRYGSEQHFRLSG